MIEIKLAKRLNNVAESATLKMAAATRRIASEGFRVINFAVGEPDFPVPQSVAKAAIEAINQGFNKYTPVAGIPELKNRIARKFAEDNRLSYAPDCIVVSCGAKQALFNFLLAVLSPGDEVIVPTPYWVSYPEMVKLAEGTPVIVKTTESTQFKLTPELLKKHLTPKTKVLLLNSPSNPSGIVYSRAEYEGLAKCLQGTNILVCSDEIYEKLVFDGEFVSFGAVSADAFQRTVTVNGFSKAYSMTGWRLGYAAGPKPIMDAMSLIQGQSTSGANSIAQKAAVTALEIPDSALRPLAEAFRKRRDLMAEIFSGCEQLSFLQSKGAFYFFLNVKKVLGKRHSTYGEILTSDQLALYLLEVAHVGTVPGSGFGEEGYLRISFAVSDADVEEGSKKIVAAIRQLQ